MHARTRPQPFGDCQPLAGSPCDDQDGVVAGDRADHFRPAGLIDRCRQRPGTARDRPDDEQRAHAVQPDEQRRGQLAEPWPDGRVSSLRPVGRHPAFGDLGEPELPQVPREGGLRDVDSIGRQRGAELVLAPDPPIADESKDRCLAGELDPGVPARTPRWN